MMAMWRTYVGHTHIKMYWVILCLQQQMGLDAVNPCGGGGALGHGYVGENMIHYNGEHVVRQRNIKNDTKYGFQPYAKD